MFKTVKYKILILTTILTMLLSACAPQTPTEDPAISTAVAQTIAAQNAGSSTETPLPSITPAITEGPLQFIPTLTPLVPVASPTQPKSTAGARTECGRASLVSETIPDGTIYAPGASFTKTWEIKNESNCTWDTSYKIVFWDGDVMGGGYVYNLPQSAPPGTTFPISLVLKAPAAEGPYISEWMLQTPDGTEFGLGEYSASFYADIVVSAAAEPVYGITAVDYQMVRSPATGCPANTRYTLYATITSNGPIEITYQWKQGSGTPEVELLRPPKVLKFTEASSQTVSHEAVLHLGATPGDQRWKSLVITEPFHKEYERIHYLYDCGDY
jgi:hypothetical protein